MWKIPSIQDLNELIFNADNAVNETVANYPVFIILKIGLFLIGLAGYGAIIQGFLKFSIIVLYAAYPEFFYNVHLLKKKATNIGKNNNGSDTGGGVKELGLWELLMRFVPDIYASANNIKSKGKESEGGNVVEHNENVGVLLAKGLGYSVFIVSLGLLIATGVYSKVINKAAYSVVKLIDKGIERAPDAEHIASTAFGDGVNFIKSDTPEAKLLKESIKSAGNAIVSFAKVKDTKSSDSIYYSIAQEMKTNVVEKLFQDAAFVERWKDKGYEVRFSTIMVDRISSFVTTDTLIWADEEKKSGKLVHYLPMSSLTFGTVEPPKGYAEITATVSKKEIQIKTERNSQTIYYIVPSRKVSDKVQFSGNSSGLIKAEVVNGSPTYSVDSSYYRTLMNENNVVRSMPDGTKFVMFKDKIPVINNNKLILPVYLYTADGKSAVAEINVVIELLNVKVNSGSDKYYRSNPLSNTSTGGVYDVKEGSGDLKQLIEAILDSSIKK